MAFIVYGRHRAPIDLGEAFVKCPHCEAHNWADMMVYSNYYHVYWIPMFPFDKEANLICTKCGLKRYGMGFSNKLLDNFDELKKKFKHPWYTYIGIAAFLLIVIGGILSAIFK